MKKYVIATIKSWNINNYEKLIRRYPQNKFYLFTDKEELNGSRLTEIEPDYIFFPHWSWKIPKDIYSKYKCVVFHMTDLPFGRGGSPLQNLIVRGIYNTKISAIAVDEGIDSGAIYIQESFDISTGTADEILKRASNIIFEKMISRFISDNLVPREQEGEVVLFKRRAPKDSEMPNDLSIKQIYDFIRMLDGEGYPVAYSDVGDKRIYYRNAQYVDGKVSAEITIVKR